MASHAEDIQKHVRVYMVVFASLAALTVVTVAISYLHLETHAAIAVALLVAVVKGSLVCLYFMHLISEEKTIYWLLGMTAVFFAGLMYLPPTWTTTGVEAASVWDVLPAEGVTTHSSSSAHGGSAAEEAGHH